MKRESLEGMVFDRLTVLKEHGRTNTGRITWKCKCSCGNISYPTTTDLRSGHSTSCGHCRRAESNKGRGTHNLSNSRLYKILHGMKTRCFNKDVDAYKNYGGRGITICQEWLDDFMNFYNWAINNGYKKKLTLERNDVNGNYCPENCSWIPKAEQSLNTRANKWVEYKGKLVRVVDIANEQTTLPPRTVRSRINNGWDVDEALSKPFGYRGKRKA